MYVPQNLFFLSYGGEIVTIKILIKCEILYKSYRSFFSFSFLFLMGVGVGRGSLNC